MQICFATALGMLLLLATAAALEAPANLPAGPTCGGFPASIDPPGLQRDGRDYDGILLSGSNATLAACVALCCAAQPKCAAFSFNDPEPGHGRFHQCIGGEPCCHLKSGVPPRVNNS